jgi:lipoprotein NlpD
MRRISLILVLLMLSACTQRTNLAPVEELRWSPYNSKGAYHIVRRGETLYAIAFGHDRDYRELAAYNGLRSPYSLRVGQIIHLQGTKRRPFFYKTTPKVYRVNPPKKSQYIDRRTTTRTGTWQWPAQGRVVSNYYPGQGKKGIDIAGKKGDSVKASAAGIIAYAGSGLNGYGNLIIIKHNNQFMTAYGNNQRIRVKEGQKVRAGEIIADMGVIDRRYWGVHFEIRKAGQPVNPMGYLVSYNR